MSTSKYPVDTDPLRVTTLTPVSCASILWSQAGILWATVAVKGTFSLVHEGEAQLAAPVAVVHEDRCRITGSVEQASEMAPYLPNVGVILSGYACSPGGRPVTSAAARLGLSGDRRLLDKTLHIYGDRMASSGGVAEPFKQMPIVYERAFGGSANLENPVGMSGDTNLPNIVDAVDPRRPGGFGPIARHWPARQRLLGSLDPRAITARVPELPPGVDWRYFQTAPNDQQIDALHGREWIVLDGMHAELPRIQTRLPQIIARAEWLATSAGGASPTRSIDLRADTLVIDTDRLVCSVVWRGRFPLSGLDAVPHILVVAGIEISGHPLSVQAQETMSAAPQSGESGLPPATPSSGGSQMAHRRNPLAATADPDPRLLTAPIIPFQPGTAGAHTGAARQPESPPVLAPRLARAPSHLKATLDPCPAGPVGPVLPFVPNDPRREFIEPPPVLALRLARAPSHLKATLDPCPVGPVGPALPFAPKDSLRPLMAVAASEPAQPVIEALRSEPPAPLSQTDAGARATLESAAPPAMIGPLATLEMAERSASPAHEDVAPAAPLAPAAVASEALPIDAFPIERCAATAASMARRTEERAKILEENELTPKTWDALVGHWAEEIREETKRGKTALLNAYDHAYLSRLEEERGPIRAEDYARLLVAEERGNAEEVLAKLTLPPGAMMRLQRVWVRRIAADAAVGASVRKATEAARSG